MVFLPELDKHLSLHGRYLKDPAEYINKEGRLFLVENLNQIGLYGTT